MTTDHPSRTVGRGRSLRIAVAAVALTLLGAGGCLPAASAAGDGPSAYVGHAYASSRPPSADKPQSKLWFHDGSWWALLVGEGSTSVFVHELMPDHTWRNTGALIDTRDANTGDALWSDQDDRLYVASRAWDSDLQVSGLDYDPATRGWSMAAGFPLTVENGGASESATIDQDALGNLWVSYTRASRVWVSHSTDASRTRWTTGFQPDVPDPVIDDDDVSAVITFGSSIGLMWSDQESDAYRFAVRDVSAPDGAPWQVEDALVGAGLADDHINLKHLAGDPHGRIFAAVKTTAEEGTDPDAALIGVLVRTPGADGAPARWSFTPAGTVAQGWTRPILMIDDTNDELYLFVTSSATHTGGDILYRRAELPSDPADGLSFTEAQIFLADGYAVNDVTGAKHPATGETGMVVLATSHGQKRYAHAELALQPGGMFDEDGAGTVRPAVAATTPTRAATGVAVEAGVAAVAVTVASLLVLQLSTPLIRRLRRRSRR